MFILDSSVGKEDFKRIKNFMKSVVRYFNIAPKFVRVGALAYSTLIRGFDLSKYKNMRQVLRAIDKIPYKSGWPDLGATLAFLKRFSYTRQFGGRPHVMNIAIIITNGKSEDPSVAVQQAENLKRAGVKVFVVATGHVLIKQVEKMASTPDDWFILRVLQYKQLEEFTLALVYRIYWGKFIIYLYISFTKVIFHMNIIYLSCKLKFAMIFHPNCKSLHFSVKSYKNYFF